MAGALATATQAMAAPSFTPFLSVDVNGYNAGGGQSLGPTESGYQGWEMAEGLFLDPSIDWGNSGAAGLTKVFPTSEGNITANLKGIVPNSFRGARNRGDNTDAQGDMTQEFVFSQRGVDGLGQTYSKLTLSGLIPGQVYEFTGYARDHFNGGGDSFQAWSDRGFLGVDGPGAWMDANVGAGSLYQPAAGGVNNPIPTKMRSPVSGPASADPYGYAATYRAVADGSGVLELYTWADPNSFSGTQSATLLNGFQLSVAPEPTSLAMFAMGLIGLLFVGRRR
jgi:PEP-CTERM motif